MKTLILVRHAKSDWSADGLPDFDRPLNERGKRDAPVMAARLAEKIKHPDAIVASPAKRAAKTAKLFAQQFGISKDAILYKDELYLPPPAVFYSVIEKLDDQFLQVLIFSHNNGITDFANELTDARIDNIPTCGIFAVQADIDSWKDFRTAEKTFLFVDYPKAK
ncbi:MAG: histidine phosphatase family protein [Chitinophagales bacterium]|nr:histidine phosphatase family protein [Chitinophagales bacterium]